VAACCRREGFNGEQHCELVRKEFPELPDIDMRVSRPLTLAAAVPVSVGVVFGGTSLARAVRSTDRPSAVARATPSASWAVHDGIIVVVSNVTRLYLPPPPAPPVSGDRSFGVASLPGTHVVRLEITWVDVTAPTYTITPSSLDLQDEGGPSSIGGAGVGAARIRVGQFVDNADCDPGAPTPPPVTSALLGTVGGRGPFVLATLVPGETFGPVPLCYEVAGAADQRLDLFLPGGEKSGPAVIRLP